MATIARQGYLSMNFKKLNAEIPVQEFAAVLSSEPNTVLSSLALAVHHSILRLQANRGAQRIRVTAPRIHVRLEGYQPLTPMRLLKSNFIDKFVALRGNVVRVGNIKPLVLAMNFQCAKCGTTVDARFDDGRYAPPQECEGRCKSRNFTPNRASIETVDFQRIKLQEIVSGGQADQGRIPRTIECELLSDLVDGCIPGDVVTVSGVVKARKILGGPAMPGQQKALFQLYVEANFIENGNKNQNSKLDVFSFTANDYQMVQEIWASDNLFTLLVQSICPSIYGHDLVKAGLLLALFGGTDKNKGADKDRMAVRGDPHVLIVGDPGLGKSQLLRAAASVAPRAVYVCGNTTSSAGLTVTMVREDKGGDAALEAGALVLADQGCCCIDEFDKMKAEHNALLEAMEQQSISIAKAGVVCSLAARTSIIAAANPIGGHYDRTRTVAENIKIPAPLLSRFDIVFILLDKPDADRDLLLSEHVLAMHAAQKTTKRLMGAAPPQRIGLSQPGASLFSQSQSDQADPSQREWEASRPLSQRLALSPQQQRELEVIPQPLLRKYIAYARKYCSPRLCEGAKDVLRSFYHQLREDHKTADSTPVTTRQLESMIRLSEARAKAELREVVTVQDAEDVVEIIKVTTLV
jgi:DNA helicase MCM8